MGIYDELQKISTDSPTPKPARKAVQKKREGVTKEVTVNQSTNQSTNQSIDQSIDQLINQFTEVDELGPVVGKPRGFYITQKVDHWLDDAVRYLQSKGLHKVDRSVLLNTLVHNPDLYKPVALDGLRNRILAHLTNKSLERVQSTDQSIDQSTDQLTD